MGNFSPKGLILGGFDTAPAKIVISQTLAIDGTVILLEIFDLSTF
jgi:hypothetical protein